MYKAQDFLIDEQGNAVSGATLTVRVAATPAHSGVVAAIYSDDGITLRANPTTTASDGGWFFYAADGTYDLEFEYGTSTAELTDFRISDVNSQGSTDVQWKVTDLDVVTEFEVPTVAPGAPAAGNVWEASGVLKHGASSKTVADLETEQTFSAAQAVVAPASAGKVALTVKGNATAGADVVEIFNSAGTPALQSWFDSTGELGTNLNVKFKSGTSNTMTFDHNLAASRTITFPDAGADATVVYGVTPGTSGSDINWNTSTGTLNVPNAGVGVRGVVSTGSQTFDGQKTFDDGLVTTGAATTLGGTALTVSATTTTFSGETQGRIRQDETDVAIGHYALAAQTLNSSDANVAIGFKALEDNLAGTSNQTAVGSYALMEAATNGGNTAVGSLALRDLTTGSDNVSIGYESMQFSTNSSSSTAVGGAALKSNLTGTRNTAVGASAMVSSQTGNDNVAMGWSAMVAANGSSNNVAIGDYAMNDMTAANNNVAVGMECMYTNTTGTGNTAVGFEAGRTGTVANGNLTGSYNTFLGYQAGPLSPTQVNVSGAIGAGATVTGDNTMVIGDYTLPIKTAVGLPLASDMLEVADVTNLASESLTNGALTSGTNWTAAGDFALTANAATYTHSAGSGSITQASGTLAVAGKTYRWYKLTYNITSPSGDATLSVSNAFAGISQTLRRTTGSHTLIFKSTATPGNFVITGTSTSGAITIDTLSLKEITGGNISTAGLYTGGGGVGIKVDGSGNVSIGASAPAEKLEVTGNILQIANQSDVELKLHNTAAGGRHFHVGSGANASGFPNSFYVYDATAAAIRAQISSTGATTLYNDTTVRNASTDTNLKIFNSTAGGNQFILGVGGTGSAFPAALSIFDTNAGLTRAVIESDGDLRLYQKLGFDDGAGAIDTNLYRSSANVLKTDDALVVASNSATALTVGANGATNPVVQVNAATASAATGISITGAAAAGGVAVAAISSGSDEALKIDAKGTGTITLAGTSTGNVVVPRAFVQGTDATDRVTIKGMYMSPANVSVTVPAIANDAAENIDTVAVNVSAAFSMQPAVGDMVIAIPQEALETDCVLLNAYVTNTDEITVAFGSKEGGAGVTGGAKNFKFMVFDLT